VSHAERRRVALEIADTAIHERQDEVSFLMQEGKRRPPPRKA
jgi:hypothetical protein